MFKDSRRGTVFWKRVDRGTSPRRVAPPAQMADGELVKETEEQCGEGRLWERGAGSLLT